jgi:hypothetical protein
MTKILEMYGVSTRSNKVVDWENIVLQEYCPYLNRRCYKTRKSNPNVTIGTCTVTYGKEEKNVIICPARLLERRQIFIDCLHLLTLHEPGNELHIVPEISIPGGNVDFFLVSARKYEIRDFVGLELQTLDTTGTTWSDRQRFLYSQGFKVDTETLLTTYNRTFGMNWKMTAKTILMQVHHKVQTFEEINKHLVLVIQDHFMDYIKKEFQFSHLNQARLGDSAQFHVYGLQAAEDLSYHLELSSRFSTDANGIARGLGLQTSSKLEIEEIVGILKTKISERTRFTLS